MQPLTPPPATRAATLSIVMERVFFGLFPLLLLVGRRGLGGNGLIKSPTPSHFVPSPKAFKTRSEQGG
jgi:hypothetical protein